MVSRVDHVLCVDATRETARIQETHILIGHTLCELVEQQLAARAQSLAAAPRRSRKAKAD